MKIIIDITDAGNDMVRFSFKREPDDTDSFAVLRATARLSRAICQEHAFIHRESNFIEDELLVMKKPPESENN